MKTHRTDAVSLAFGVIFLSVVGWWALGQAAETGFPPLGWFVAAGLLVFGLLGLLGALRGGRHTDSRPPAIVSGPPAIPADGEPPTAETTPGHGSESDAEPPGEPDPEPNPDLTADTATQPDPDLTTDTATQPDPDLTTDTATQPDPVTGPESDPEPDREPGRGPEPGDRTG